MTVSLSALPEKPWPQHGVAVHPKKAPRCWVRSVCVRELWGRRTPREPQTRLRHGRRLQMLLERGCPGGGKAKSPEAAVRREQAARITAVPALIWLFHLWGRDWIRWGTAGEGGDAEKRTRSIQGTRV